MASDIRLDEIHELVLQETIGPCFLSTVFGEYARETAIKVAGEGWDVIEEDYPSKAATTAGHARWVELLRCGHGA
jgi:hypothetical protein